MSANDRKPAARGRNNLVALGTAAVLAVYAAGFDRTRAAAQKFAEADAAQRRPAPPSARLGDTLISSPAPRPVDPAGLLPPPGRYDVRILRDTWGVPHVFGRTDADVAYGLAFAHAEDDFQTIQWSLLAARGRLATVLGPEGAPNDFVVQLLRVREVVDAGYERDLSPEPRALCEAYAGGVNH